MYEIEEIQSTARYNTKGSTAEGELLCEFEFTQIGSRRRLPKLNIRVRYSHNQFKPSPWTVLLKPEGDKYLFHGDVEGMTDDSTVDEVLEKVYELTRGFEYAHDNVSELPPWMQGDPNYKTPAAKDHSVAAFNPALAHELRREKERNRDRPMRRPF